MVEHSPDVWETPPLRLTSLPCLCDSVSETLLYCSKWIIYEEKRLLIVLKAGRSKTKVQHLQGAYTLP